jgi:uncharacterized protein YbjT (DUF2867 family)
VIAVAGATGYIGGLLGKRLREQGEDVRVLARDPAGAADLEKAGCEIVEADVLKPETLGPALEGADVAYYLVHSMGRGSEDGDPARQGRRQELRRRRRGRRGRADRLPRRARRGLRAPRQPPRHRRGA